MNQTDGIALQWTRVNSIPGVCQDRTAVDCGAPSGANDQTALDNLVQTALGACLGSESWLNVAFADGCATRFALSSTAPADIACVQAQLGAGRLSCASSVGCAGVLVSTLH